MSLADRLDSARRSALPTEPTSPTEQARGGRRRASDPFTEVKGRVHQALIDNLGPRLYDPHLPEAELAAQVRQTLQETIDAEQTPLSHADRTRIAQEVSDEILGHGPLEPLLRDPDISEIMVNGADYVYVERSGKLYPVDARFSNEAHLRRVIDKIVGRVGRRIDEASPLVDARLPDGSRVNAVISPVALDGAMLTIRKFSQDPFNDADLIAFGTFSPMVRDFLKACVLGRRNIVISGGTGSGKTTTLNVISSFIPEDERIVTIEDAAELQLHQEHVLRLESRPANIEGRGQIEIRDLVKNSLRMRPDRIVVGETRGEEALDMLQAMNTGHDGSLTTVHANTPRDSLSRIETMIAMGATNLPERAMRQQIAAAIQIVVQQSRMSDGTRKVTAISEITGMEGDVITMQEIFLFEKLGVTQDGKVIGRFRATGVRPKVCERLKASGIHLPPDMFEGVTEVR